MAFPSRLVEDKSKSEPYCDVCEREGRPHQIVEVPNGVTDSRSCWGPGIPSHKRRCTGCNREDGPWIHADVVGGGY